MALTKVTGQVINNTTDLVVGVTTVGGGLSATDGFFSGIVTFSSDVSVGGTLTYEDVTNIDSVGLITARNGIVVGSGITLSKDGDGFFTGVVTATSYAGDGSALTGIAATDNVRTGILDVAGVATFRNDVNIPDKIIHLGDTNTAIRFPEADTVSVETGGTEALRVDSSQRLVLGATSQRTVWGGQQKLSIEGLDGATSSASIVRNSNDAFYPFIALGKSRGTSDGSSTIVQDDDVIGILSFNAADGTDMTSQTAYIESAVDGTPGSNDTPGRLVFYTTADGASSSTERLRITSSGEVGINNSSPDNLFKLDVNGGVRIGNNVDGVIIENAGSNANVDNAACIRRHASTGNLHITAGTSIARNLIFGTKTSGGEIARFTDSGLCFNGDTAESTALDDYEEGTWNPQIGGSTAVGSYTRTSEGYYVKVGKQVTAWLNCTGSVSGASGSTRIYGLPFTAASNSASNGYTAVYSAGSVQYWSGFGSADILGALIVVSTTYIYFHTDNGSSTGANQTIQNGGHNAHVHVSYFTD